jgi:hypothetical protein
MEGSPSTVNTAKDISSPYGKTKSNETRTTENSARTSRPAAGMKVGVQEMKREPVTASRGPA